MVRMVGRTFFGRMVCPLVSVVARGAMGGWARLKRLCHTCGLNNMRTSSYWILVVAWNIREAPVSDSRVEERSESVHMKDQ